MIGRKYKHKPGETAEPTEEQKQFAKKHHFSPPVKDTIKEDSQYNAPGPDGRYELLPRQQSNIGIYRCCMEEDHQCDGAHNKDDATGLTRFWCKICGWDMTLKQSDEYMTVRMNK